VVVLDLRLDVVPVHAGEINLDAPLLIGLADVHTGRPLLRAHLLRARLPGSAADSALLTEELAEDAVHVLLHPPHHLPRRAEGR
jgi:hypothetical protein